MEEHPVTELELQDRVPTIVGLEIGALAVIRLKENPSTGYKWQHENSNPAAVEVSSTYQTARSLNESGAELRIGGSGIRVFTLKALAAGTSEIILQHCRPWVPPEEADPNEMIRHVTINVI